MLKKKKKNLGWAQKIGVVTTNRICQNLIICKPKKEKGNFESKRESNRAELKGLCRKDNVVKTVRQVFGYSF